MGSREKRFGFTEARLKAIVPTDAVQTFFDPATPGFTFVVTPTGKKSYYWYRRVPGKDEEGEPLPPRRYKLGDFPGMSLEAKPNGARATASRLNGKVDQGVDPIAELEAAQAKAQEAATVARAKAGATVGGLWAGYLAHHLSGKKQRTRDEFTRLYTNHLAAFADRAADSITEGELETFKLELGKAHGQYTANRTLAVLSSMYTQRARAIGLPPKFNPVEGVARFPETKRRRVLEDEELARLYKSLDADENPIVTDYFKMLLMTGQRKMNVATMEVDHIKRPNIGTAVWKIPGELTKNSEPLIVTLPPAAVAIIERRIKDNPPGCKFIFPARRVTPEQVEQIKALREEGQSTHAIAKAMGIGQTTVMTVLKPGYQPKEQGAFNGGGKAWERILKRANLTGARIHDLRRTFGTILAESGVSLPVAAKIMGHRRMETTNDIYSHARVKAMTEAHLTGAASIENRIEAETKKLPDAGAA